MGSITFDEHLLREAIAECEEEDREMNRPEGEYGDSEEAIPSPKAKKIRFTFELDHTLLLETSTVNPFKDNKQWSTISHNVTSTWRAVTKDDLFLQSSRACREHINLLMTQPDDKLKRYVRFDFDITIGPKAR